MRQTDHSNYLEDGLDLHRDPASKLWVIPKDLCTRCGVCHVICPTDVIRFDQAEFPYIQMDGCINCGLCLKVCPGIDFDLPKFNQQMFGVEYRNQVIGGFFSQAYVGFSTDPTIRHGAASGGVVTQILLSLLRAGKIDGAVVVTSNPDDPMDPLPIIARSEQEIREAAQSKYSVVANTKVLRQLRNSQERFAFVGVSCQVQGLRKLQELNKRFLHREVITIGLACRGTFEREAIRDLLSINAIYPHHVRQIDYRGGEFPGKLRACMKDGEVKDLHRFDIKDGAYNTMFRLYTPARCHLCPDYSAEFSDVTCMDIFLRARSGDYQYPEGSTLVLCRTPRGKEMIESLINEGCLELEPLTPDIVEKAHAHHKKERKIFPFLRISELRKLGASHPDYGVEVRFSRRQKLHAGIHRLTFVFSSHARLRRQVLAFFLSPAGGVLIFLKIKFKKYRAWWRARNSR